REHGQPPQVPAREEVDHAEQGALLLVEELGERRRVDAGSGDVGAQPVGGEQHQGHEHPALELRNLEDVLEALQAFDHLAALSLRPGRISTRPPAASTFCLADSLTLCTRTVSACATAPSPRTLTALRPDLRMSRLPASASGSTTLPAANRSERSPTLTIANSV